MESRFPATESSTLVPDVIPTDLKDTDDGQSIDGKEIGAISRTDHDRTHPEIRHLRITSNQHEPMQHWLERIVERGSLLYIEK